MHKNYWKSGTIVSFIMVAFLILSDTWRSLEHHQNVVNVKRNARSPKNLSQICILVPVTSREQVWESLNDTFLVKLSLPSITRTYEPNKYEYTIFIGYDTDDLFFDNNVTLSTLRKWVEINIPFASLEIVSFINHLHKPGPIMNFISNEAYKKQCDFMYRINDDTELITPNWTSAFVSTLRSFTPPLHGVVGPICHQGNPDILTHDFVHRSHLSLFQIHYPPELTDWWLDDWISLVYGETNTQKLDNCEVRHHLIPIGGDDYYRRYYINKQARELLPSLLDQGRKKIKDYLQTSQTQIPTKLKTHSHTPRKHRY